MNRFAVFLSGGVFIIGATMVVGSHLWAAVPSNQPATEESTNSPLAELLARLRTPLLKEQAVKLAPDLLNRDTRIAREAVDFFCDIRANEVLVWGLANKNMEVKVYVAVALRETACPGDVGVATTAASQLAGTTTLMTGGSEVHIPRAQYRLALATLLESLTQMSLVPKADAKFLSEVEVPAILAEVRKWLAAHEPATQPK